jgi:hypothetical protein
MIVFLPKTYYFNWWKCSIWVGILAFNTTVIEAMSIWENFEVPFQDQKIGVWFAVTAYPILGPVFLKALVFRSRSETFWRYTAMVTLVILFMVLLQMHVALC